MKEKTYTQSPFRGQIHCPAVVTPFSAEGDVMLDAYQELVRFYVEDVRADALLIAGDNG